MKTEHILPADIEKKSMEIIERELAERKITVAEENKAVVKRVIHTTADFEYVDNLRFTENAAREIATRLKDGGLTLVTDTNMALSGVSKPSLKKLGCEAVCLMADGEIAEEARERRTTRAAVSMEKAAERFDKVAFAVGNAPTALISISKMIEEGLRPAFIIGVPVGFVNVVESKEEILEAAEKHGIPAIVAAGRKGGSNVAAAIMNALMYEATDMLDPQKRYETVKQTAKVQY